MALKLGAIQPSKILKSYKPVTVGLFTLHFLEQNKFHREKELWKT